MHIGMQATFANAELTYNPLYMSPVIVFAYNRPQTTEKLLASLIRCKECAESELYVFIDGPRHAADEEKTRQVREKFEELDAFKAIHIHASETNKGLAASIIEGVSQVMCHYENAIVLEDDLVVTHDFLRYMNNGLEMFKNRKDIWSISGYTPDLDIPDSHEQDAFLVPRAQSWGWATWRDRWEKVDWDVKDFKQIAESKKEQEAFNRGGNDLFRTLDMERHGKIESWAIRWAYAAFRNNAYTVNPIASKVRNIGANYNNVHFGWHDSRHDVVLSPIPIRLEPDMQPDEAVMELFKRHHDLGIVSSIGYFMRRHGFGHSFVHRVFEMWS